MVVVVVVVEIDDVAVDFGSLVSLLADTVDCDMVLVIIVVDDVEEAEEEIVVDGGSMAASLL